MKKKTVQKFKFGVSGAALAALLVLGLLMLKDVLWARSGEPTLLHHVQLLVAAALVMASLARLSRRVAHWVRANRKGIVDRIWGNDKAGENHIALIKGWDPRYELRGPAATFFYLLPIESGIHNESLLLCDKKFGTRIPGTPEQALQILDTDVNSGFAWILAHVDQAKTLQAQVVELRQENSRLSEELSRTQEAKGLLAGERNALRAFVDRLAVGLVEISTESGQNKTFKSAGAVNQAYTSLWASAASFTVHFVEATLLRASHEARGERTKIRQSLGLPEGDGSCPHCGETYAKAKQRLSTQS